MDQTRTPPSEYLQACLHHVKTDVGKTEHPLRLRKGRDDDIFNTINDDEDRQTRRTSTYQYTSSPAAPSAWRGVDRQNEAPPSRRTSGIGPSPNLTPRTMGARDVEDHLDRLSKQNFDLKLEVYHRREKMEVLERKLLRFQRMQEDKEELLEVNDELVAELEKRDRAVDEAVAMICDLEDKVKSLEQKLGEHQGLSQDRRTAKIDTTCDDHETPTLNTEEARDRLTNLPLPIQPLSRPTAVPSFIQNQKPSTRTLRRMYMNGDKVIRPLPSYRTLGSANTDDEDDDNEDDITPQSPHFSILSKSDLGSLYASDEPPNYSKSKRVSQTASEATSGNEDMSPGRRTSRVTQWVTERAISPPQPHRFPKASAPPAEQFQSLERVLHQPRAVDPNQPSAMPKKKKASNLRAAAVDTQVPQTRSSNQSYPPSRPTSMITELFGPYADMMDQRENFKHDNTSLLEEQQRNHPHTLFDNKSTSSPHPPGPMSVGSILTQAMGSHESSEMPVILRRSNAKPEETGLSLYTRYYSDDSASHETAEDPEGELNTRGLITNGNKHAIDDGLAHAKAQAGHIAQRTRHSMHLESPTPATKPIPTQIRTEPQGSDLARMSNDDSTPTAASFAAKGRSRQTRAISGYEAASVLDRASSNNSGISNTRKQETSLEHDTSSDRSIPLAAGLRQRVKQFIRRSSTSSKNSGQEHDTTTPKRSSSITDRFRLGRRSSQRRDPSDRSGQKLELNDSAKPVSDLVSVDPVMPATTSERSTNPVELPATPPHLHNDAAITSRASGSRSVHSVSTGTSTNSSKILTPSGASSVGESEAGSPILTTVASPGDAKKQRPLAMESRARRRAS